MKTTPHLNRGLTLVELLAVLAILAISLGIAVPGIQSLVSDTEKTRAVNAYLGAFAFTRHQAVTTRTVTAICPLNKDNRCVDDWNQPVSIFPDANRDQKPDDRKIWRILRPTSNHLQIHTRTAGRGSFHFGPDGLVYGTTGSLVLCPDNIASGRMTYIAVSRGGRTRQVSDDDGDGFIRLSWGGTVHCPGVPPG